MRQTSYTDIHRSTKLSALGTAFISVKIRLNKQYNDQFVFSASKQTCGPYQQLDKETTDLLARLQEKVSSRLLADL